jgi:hypothetical protein
MVAFVPGNHGLSPSAILWPAAALSAILREQLEYLIDHAGARTEAGCPACARYLRVRSVLLEIFCNSADAPPPPGK